ncbi:MAG: cation:proton antiporter, partial [Candidatus Thermoplasmatota archaeon]|nr:cation:proton antiporter [Candidatus Thermoplasmatota archaeon]
FTDLANPYTIGILLIMTVIAIISKAVPLLLSRYFKHKWSDLGGAFLLGTNLSVVVAGVNMGRKAGILGEDIAAALILYGVISCILFPALFKKIFKKYLERYMDSNC